MSFINVPFASKYFTFQACRVLPEVILSCSLCSSGSIYSRDEGEWGASNRFLAVYGDQAWVQELAGGEGGYVRRLNWGLHEVHTEDYALDRFSLQSLMCGTTTYQFVCSYIYLSTLKSRPV